MFLQVCVILFTGGHAWLLWGACMVATGGVHGCPRGHAWLLQGGHVWLLRRGGVHGCSQGACVVAARGAWLLSGGVHGCSQGGMHGCSGEGTMHGCSGGCAWLLPGGMHGCCWGACMVAPGRVHGIRQDTEMRSMSGRYTSYWNAFLLFRFLVEFNEFYRIIKSSIYSEQHNSWILYRIHR